MSLIELLKRMDGMENDDGTWIDGFETQWSKKFNPNVVVNGENATNKDLTAFHLEPDFELKD